MATTSTHTATTCTGTTATRRSTHHYTHACIQAISIDAQIAELELQATRWQEILDGESPNSADRERYTGYRDDKITRVVALRLLLAAGETHIHDVISWHKSAAQAMKKAGSEERYYAHRYPGSFAYVVEVERR